MVLWFEFCISRVTKNVVALFVAPLQLFTSGSHHGTFPQVRKLLISHLEMSLIYDKFFARVTYTSCRLRSGMRNFSSLLARWSVNADNVVYISLVSRNQVFDFIYKYKSRTKTSFHAYGPKYVCDKGEPGFVSVQRRKQLFWSPVYDLVGADKENLHMIFVIIL